MSQRLTDKIVKALEPPAKGNRITYDTEVKGFGARITTAGTRAFVLNYRRRPDGLQRRYTIGSFPDWSTATAREEAKRFKREIDGGSDPVGKLQADRTAPTVADLCTRFIAEHLPSKRASTRAGYGGIISKYVIPQLGNKTVVSIAYADVAKLHRYVTTEGGPYIANRAMAVLAKMFSLSIRWGMRTDSPVRGVERNLESKRTRYLTIEEMLRLSAVLSARGDMVADVIRLLLLTGARKGEVLSARWEHIDLVRGVWSKPASSTKQKTAHVVPLSGAARRVLADIYEKQGTGQEWVFPGRTGHLHRIDNQWILIRKQAGLPGVRIHDLRHTYASLLASSGQSLPIIGALLGHTNPATTARYAHLFDDPLRAATEGVGKIVSGGNIHGR